MRSLVVERVLPRLAPAQAFELWTRPEGLVRWWPDEAEVDAGEGGTYHLAWPDAGWHLRGRYVEWDPPGHHSFTWPWDHTPDGPETTVRLAFEPASGGGAALRLEHGPYAEGASGDALRRSHADGWEHFLGRLATCPLDKERRNRHT